MKMLLTVFGVWLTVAAAQAAAVQETELHDFTVEVIADQLDHPWSVEFLPGGGYLVTERPGHVSRVSDDGTVVRLEGAPEVSGRGQGGMLDIRLDPEFGDNRRVFICYAGGGLLGAGTELASATLGDDRLEDLQVLFQAEPKVFGGRHFGCRIAFDDDGRLYLALGDRGDRDTAQDLSVHHGSIMRLNRDGSIPHDNPFLGIEGARPEIFTYGNRNPQAMVRRPGSDDIWSVEHGPQGGDEVNIIRGGNNYGWPVVSFGAEYGSGTPIGEGAHKEGMTDPVYYWDPSIAPSGMAFYEGDAFPAWNGSLLVGALKFRLLVRLTMDGDQVVAEERMLEDEIGRIRDVRVGPDGLVYLLTDADPGKLVRLVPVE